MTAWIKTTESLPKSAGTYQIFPDPMRDCRVSVATYIPADNEWTDLVHDLPAEPLYWAKLNEVP